MSKYTTEVRHICEQLAGADSNVYFSDVTGIIEKAAPQIFDFDFPIYNEDYRLPLEKHILLHFYMREICGETYGEWKLRLMQTLNDVMPEINELYKSVEFKYDPMTDLDYITDTQGTTAGKTTMSNNSKEGNTRNETENQANSGENKETNTRDNTQMYSDTPQGNLENVKEGKYLTNATVGTGTNVTATVLGTKYDTTRNTTATSEHDYNSTGTDEQNRSLIVRTFGKSTFRSYGRLLQEFRDNILNVDMVLFKKLEPCFMLIY